MRPREPQPAMAMSSASDEAPSELAQRRREIEVRALFDIGRHGEAFALLEGATDPGAILLRADLLWRMKDWPKAAAAMVVVAADRMWMPR